MADGRGREGEGGREEGRRGGRESESERQNGLLMLV